MVGFISHVLRNFAAYNLKHSTESETFCGKSQSLKLVCLVYQMISALFRWELRVLFNEFSINGKGFLKSLRLYSHIEIGISEIA